MTKRRPSLQHTTYRYAGLPLPSAPWHVTAPHLRQPLPDERRRPHRLQPDARSRLAQSATAIYMPPINRPPARQRNPSAEVLGPRLACRVWDGDGLAGADAEPLEAIDDQRVATCRRALMRSKTPPALGQPIADDVAENAILRLCGAYVADIVQGCCASAR